MVGTTRHGDASHQAAFALFDPAQTPVDLKVYLVADLAIGAVLL